MTLKERENKIRQTLIPDKKNWNKVEKSIENGNIS